MRDLVVFMLFIGVLPLCFVRPWVGLCTFTWLAYNRTQDLTWGFARTLPFSQLVAIFMLLGWLVMEFRPIKLRGPMVKTVVLLLIWIGIANFATGLNWNLQGRRYTEFAKVVLISLITGSLMVNRHRLRVLMAVISCALGFYGFKNGILLMMGSRSIAGPGGMLLDNNDFALALVMTIPLLYYLADEMAELPYGFYIRRFMKAAFVLTFLAVVSTGSRGGFLSMAVAVFMMAWKTKYKVPAIAVMVLVGVVGAAAVPSEYRERISSIFAGSDEMDGSVQGRLVSWQVAGNMIKGNPIFGIGMNRTVKEYNKYTQGIVNEQGTTDHFARVTHNSYLQIWAESGTPAYLMFMFICLGTIIGLEFMWRRYKREGDEWVVPYCHAIQISFCSFMIGATFLNRSHFDLIYQLVVIVSGLPVVVAAERVRQAKVAKRVGPRIADEVEVAHRDPFVQVTPQ
jgi:putative inorganic carbon (HCO3(-)) transporter